MIAASLSNFALVDFADADARILLARLDQPVDQRDHVDPDVELVGVEILGLGVARRLDPARDMRGGGGPSSPSAAGRSRRSASPGSSQIEIEIGPSAFVMPSSRSHCSAWAISAAAASPSSASNRPHWPRPGSMWTCTRSSTWALIRPTMRPPRSARNRAARPWPNHGILLGVEQGMDFALERRDPRRIVLIDLPREIDERLAVAAGRDGADDEVAHGRRRASEPRRGLSPRVHRATL